ncbi:MAG: histidine kinase [Bacteroidetes bacterium]|nr:histidine kinase [Bacteroidota bacterium]
MRNNTSTYWLCQIGGWSTYCIVYTFFYFTIRTQPQPHFYETVFIDASLGLIVTHAMRLIIKAGSFFKLSLSKQVLAFVATTLVFAFCYAFLMVFVEDKLDILSEHIKKYPFINKVIRVWYAAFLFLTIWNLLYYLFHYVRKSQSQQLDKIRLESLVKELELKTIKSHIHPHFIFNTLNSIRALVDENPENARTAITQLSNILRSSMYAEKVDSSTVEKELSIVKDYLALELIRFEKRLNIEYTIDEDTLDQPVPPMMLQTLVENAIKHGISKQINGGTIKIISDFKDNYHELIVQNTGQLNGSINAEGFGIASTYDRLNLLFGNKAQFELKNIESMVQARIIMPI